MAATNKDKEFSSIGLRVGFIACLDFIPNGSKTDYGKKWRNCDAKENCVKMLWQKETIKGELVYAKLMSRKERKSFSEEFFDKILEKEFEKLFVKKGNVLALKSRKQGNGLFATGEYHAAVGVYNHTLAYTENGTEDLGFCYANRSACFLKLKEYKLCLADVELAKKNNYPARLMPKLEKRKTECLRLLAIHGDVNAQRAEPKLSFEADPKIPCFANCLEVKFSEKFGNHVTTNRNLQIGQTVIVERAFVFEATDKFYLHCENCLRRDTNLIPCENCVIAMFCSEECRHAANEKFHNVLCEIQGLFEEPHQQLLLQSIIIAIRTFSTVEALMVAVEQLTAKNGNDVHFDGPAKRQYSQFFKLRTNVDRLSVHERNEIKKEAMKVVEVQYSANVPHAEDGSIFVAFGFASLADHRLQCV